MSTYPLREARARLGSLVKSARRTGEPVVITDHGEEAVVILSIDEYRKLAAEREAALEHGYAELAALWTDEQRAETVEARRRHLARTSDW